jgi:SPP1 family predicted phage head-tail adaptor
MTRPVSGAKAGGMEQRVQIERPVVETDPTGEALVAAWVPFAKVWAEITPLSGREWLVSAEYRPGVSTKIRIRWLDGVNASMRVLRGETVYSIDAVLPKLLGEKEIWLMCGDGQITQGGQP